MKENKGYIKEYELLYGELEFEGEYLNGKRNGKGKEYYYNNKLRFEGEYLNGQIWNGKGYDPFNNIVYELKDGKGLIKDYNNKNKLSFEGEYLNGKRNGKGKEYANDEKIFFEGEYLNGKKWTGIILGKYEMKNGMVMDIIKMVK